MRGVCKKFRFWSLLLLLMLFAAGITARSTETEVQAAVKTGFQTINGKTYYIKADGTKQKGWLVLNGKKYYFNVNTGVQQKGWLTSRNGNKYYFTKGSGVMVTGWIKNSLGQKRYFDPKSGIMKTGWLTLNGKKYYFYRGSGIAATGFLTDSKKNVRYFRSGVCYMATGWLSNSQGRKRYFDPSTGIMAKGFKKLSGKYYYFGSSSGYMAVGWLTDSKGQKRYFDSNGVMATGTKTIDGVTYTFQSDGVMISSSTDSGVEFSQPTSARTIKNYLLGAMQPVGQALYVWGGGWNDSTRKGVSPTWKQWYDSQTSSYDYNNYRDLSTANRAKGLDCSGFVGWAAYQVMQSKSGVGSGYTVTADSVGSYYQSMGWGTVCNQNYLSKTNWVLRPGDVGYNSGHTWIVVGQCTDKSVVIVHSTPQAGCQLSGTPTPDGDYDSQAIALARQYMSKFKGYTKYKYNTSSGNYIRNGNYLRWNSATLSDPDGYLKKTANQILADLFK